MDASIIYPVKNYSVDEEMDDGKHHLLATLLDRALKVNDNSSTHLKLSDENLHKGVSANKRLKGKFSKGCVWFFVLFVIGSIVILFLAYKIESLMTLSP